MGQKVATLEIELAMLTGGAVASVQQFGGVIDKTTQAAIVAMDKVEAAIQGAGDMSAPSQQMVQFADATARTAISAARELARIEKAGESLSAQLERQITTFGMTTEQIQSMKVAAAALAAEEKGLTELAGRLRQQEEALNALRAQAARQAEAEAQAMRDAAQAHQLFEAAARKGAAAMRETDSAAESETRAVAALKAMLDPAAASAAATAAQVAIYDDWLKRDILTQEQHAAAVKLASMALRGHGSALGGASNASLILDHVVRATSDSIAAGQSPIRAVGMEIPRVIEAMQMWAMMAGETEGAMGKLAGFLGGGWGIALTIAFTVLAPVVAKLFEGGEASEKAAGAHRHHADAVEVLTKAIDALNGATGLEHTMAVQSLADKQHEVQADKDAAAAKLAAARASLVKAQADAQAATAANVPGTPSYVGAGAREVATEGYVKGLTAKVADLTAEIDKADVSLRGLTTHKLDDAVAAHFDKNTAAIQRYNAEHERLTGLFTKGRIGEAEYVKGMDAATAARDAVTKATHGGVGAANSLADAQGRLEGASTAVQRAEAQLAITRITTAQAVEHHTMTEQQRTDAIAAGVRAVNSARSAAKDYAKDTRDAARAVEEHKKALLDLAREWAQEEQKLSDRLDRLSVPIDVASDYKRDLADIAKIDPFAATRKAGDEQITQLEEIARRAQEVGSNMADAFGDVGSAIGKATSLLAEYAEKQKKIDQEVQLGTKSQAEARKASTDLQLNSMIGLSEAAKGLFKEHSKGYEAMAAAEKALTLIQLARTAADTVATAVSIFNSGARATADGAAAVAKSASSVPFPANIAAVGAVVALLASFGIGMLGHGGSVSATDYAKGNTGTGTVLGDTSAQSASIKNAIDALKNVDDVTLTVTQTMSVSLKSIDSNISGLATLLVRTGNIDASTGVKTGVQSTAISGIAKATVPVIGALFGGIIDKLFGSKTTIIGSGILANAQSLSAIMANGFTASYYSDIEKQKKLFGITTSTKLSTKTTGADAEIEQQFALILKGFATSISEAAGPLGIATSDVESKLSSFVVDIGKIDLKGLTGTQIQDKLEAVFGAAGDDMAKAAIPGLEKFQKVGEGYLETLVRVATTVEQVDASFVKLGLASKSMGADVDMAVAGMFDSVSDYTSAADAYFTTYYSQAEQVAAQTAQITKVFASLGLTMPSSLDGFRKLVEAQDLTTEAGQSTYATLLKLAPAFATLESSLTGAKSAADILSEREDLQSKLLDLEGNTAAIRAAELAKLDPSNRALQEQIYAIQDAQDAATAAANLASAWKTVGDSIMDEINRIRGLTDTSSGGDFASLLGQFNAATTAARAGDQDAAKSLPTLSKSLLDAAALAATSRQELDRVQAQTAASLEDTYAAIGGGTTSSSSTSTDALSSLATSQDATSTTSSDDVLTELRALRSEVAQLRGDNNDGLASIAASTGSAAKTLTNVTQASGGDAVTIAQAKAAA